LFHAFAPYSLFSALHLRLAFQEEYADLNKMSLFLHLANISEDKKEQKTLWQPLREI